MRSRSGSANSNASSKELSADNIPIYVNISGDKTIKLNVRPVHTISNLLEFLSASTNLPNDVSLLHAGKQLSPSTTVGELQLQDSATLQLQSPSRGSTPPSNTSDQPANTTTATTTSLMELKSDIAPTAVPSSSTPSSGVATPTSRTSTPVRKSNKPRCSKTGCKAHAQPIVGDCGFCQKRFCGKHRMLESHACEGLEDARQADKDRNAARLEGERTVMLRGL